MKDLQDNPVRAGVAILREQLMVEEMEIMPLDLVHIRIGTTIHGGEWIWESHSAFSKYHYQIEVIAVGID